MLITSNTSKEIALDIKDHVGAHGALIAVAEHTELDIPALVDDLNEIGVTFMGGIFPKVIHNNQVIEQGIVINTLQNLEKICLIKELSSTNYTIPKFEFQDGSYSIITYVDGLTSNISHYMSTLYENYGMQTNYFGGGAGSLSLQQKPCVFTNEGFFEDAAVYSIVKMSSHIGVKHGWSKVDGPYIVTKADGDVIQEINWQNPFEIYKTVVEKHSNKKFSDDNFFDIAKGYPFGIVKNDGECIVRDPLMTNEKGEIICIAELEDNSLVDILNGDNNSLIKAAEQAAQESLLHASKPRKAIIIDCISRVLFLETDFDKELRSITGTLKEKYPHISISGALTLGEISSYGEGFLEFYNKTVVVGLFE
ncbi:hypothetical protein BST91_11555 [Nonlabens tegetincola]|uniref:FIST signal transduction protein n=1 Tax=Nonlabens tegetincola TaxID=323273 RepID=UPI000A207D46|nr:FIST N-terminal domain-containing protein [Nonlabens tegetincola]ARN72251.1 hypothetical protein BST91_11555 [Nonlabens tegetincola]